MNRNGMDSLEKYLKQWNKIPDQLHRQLERYKVHTAIEKSMHPTLEELESEQRKLQKMIESIIKLPIFPFSDPDPFVRKIEQCNKYVDSYVDSIVLAFEGVRRSLNDQPPEIKENILWLARHVWFYDLNISISSLLEISGCEINEIEGAIVEYFESQLGVIEKSFSDKYPHRSHIISSAIKAHRNEEYFLSIPVLLAQTDGICKEVTDEYIYNKKNQKPRTATYVEQVAANAFESELLSPLTVRTPISASEKEREEGFNLLNRHMVLHGESLDYGTKVNSLKAISLINYVSQVLPPPLPAMESEAKAGSPR